LPAYQFPARTQAGLLFGMSAARLAATGAAGLVFIVSMSTPTAGRVAGGLAIIGLLLGSATVRVAGRPVVDWVPVWVAFGWRQATRNNEFYSAPDLSLDLPTEVLDLPGDLFGIEVHDLALSTAATQADGGAGGIGVIVDTFRHRQIAVAEVSAGDFLFLDPDDQQARIAAWGRVLDHVAQSLPEISRLQLVHIAGPAGSQPLSRHHHDHGGRGTPATHASYAEVVDTAAAGTQEHRLLLAVALDRQAARREIRQTGGGAEGAARVLMDRAATVEEALRAAGIEVHGWLAAATIGHILRVAFNPAARAHLPESPDEAGEGASPALAGPAGMVDGWSAVRHDSGWSTTLQIVQPPARPVRGDFLQHLLIGVPAERRMSILYIPTPLATAERRAQTQQVTTESEQALRARWGFGTSVRHRRQHEDAAQREEDLVEGRTVFKVVWLITVTAATPGELDGAIGQVEAAARRCSLELRRLAGTQRQAHGFTLPLCRGAR
jgi:hypothetical protein